MDDDGTRMLWTFLQGLLLASGIVAGTALTWGAALVGFRQATRPNYSMLSKARLRVKAASDASAQYMMDNTSKCPRGIDELISQRYLDRSNAKDPWGTDLMFHCPAICDGSRADVSSAGPDRQEGTPDDIRYWELFDAPDSPSASARR